MFQLFHVLQVERTFCPKQAIMRQCQCAALHKQRRIRIRPEEASPIPSKQARVNQGKVEQNITYQRPSTRITVLRLETAVVGIDHSKDTEP